MTTLETKRATPATRARGVLLFEHDPDHLAIRVGGSEQR
jgi:hypothetical protein